MYVAFKRGDRSINDRTKVQHDVCVELGTFYCARSVQIRLG